MRRTIIAGLLAGLVVTNLLLGFMVVTLRGDVSRVESEAAAIRGVTDRLAALEQVTSMQVPAVGEMANEIRRLKGEVFGGTTSGFISGGITALEDTVDDVQDQLDAVEQRVQLVESNVRSLRSCITQLGLQLSPSRVLSC